MYSNKEGLKLNIGCGRTWSDYKDKHGFEGVDLVDFGQKYVLDVRKELPFEDNSVDFIRTEHFLEHLTADEGIFFLNECWRILKKDSKIHIIVPHALKNKGAFVLTHRCYYTEDTFIDLGRPDRFTTYGIRRWETKNVVTNNRNDIHCYMIPLDK